MSYNHFPIINRTKRLVSRSDCERYKGKFALTTDVNLLSKFDDFTSTMQRAAASVPDAFYIHFKIDTDTPFDAVRYVPSALQSFNRTRTLRRARVSGLRMCNLFTLNRSWYYVSDMLVSCSFDAIAISAALADYSSIGSFITAQFAIPMMFKKRGKLGIRQFVDRIIDRFWSRSKLARHSVGVYFDEHRSTNEYVYIEFEPVSLSPISLLSYVLDDYKDSFIGVEVGRNSRLVITRNPIWCKEDYLIYQPDKQLNDYRYKHYAAFGIFYNNPDFPIY